MSGHISGVQLAEIFLKYFKDKDTISAHDFMEAIGEAYLRGYDKAVETYKEVVKAHNEVEK